MKADTRFIFILLAFLGQQFVFIAIFKGIGLIIGMSILGVFAVLLKIEKTGNWFLPDQECFPSGSEFTLQQEGKK